MDNAFRPKITVFHCINGISEAGLLPLAERTDAEIRIISLPCSAMVKPVYLLKAFEAGADGVMVLACPEGECHYVDGNVRTGKRVERIRHLLDEIDLDGRRLSCFNVTAEDEKAVGSMLDQVMADLNATGPNPAVLVANGGGVDQ
jgi:coenzyme F420-reducing hydrogenase delta subunit